MTQGSELALVQLYDQYADVLYRHGRGITGKPEIIEDAIQDLIAEIWYRRKTLTTPDSVKAYLLRSFRQKLFRQLLQYKRISFVGEYEPLAVLDDHHYIHTRIQSENESERTANLREAISKLSPKEQQVVALRYTENLSHDEIAIIMGIKKQTLYNLINHALRKLSHSLKSTHASEVASVSSAFWVILVSEIATFLI